MRHDVQLLAWRAHQLAASLHRSLEQERMVARFVAAYADAYSRSDLRSSPLRYRELLATIGREAWLAFAARVEVQLPARIAPRRKALRRGAEAEAASAFREAFCDEVTRILRWTSAERQEFERDLALYVQIAARQPAPMRARSKPSTEGAFVDRCALLLDPSLLDKARLAAGTFLAELEATADQALARAFQARRRP